MNKSKTIKMISSISIFALVLFVIFSSVLTGSISIADASEDNDEPGWVKNPYAWVLVGETAYNGSNDAEKYNKTNLYQRDVNYSAGNYTIRSSYVGETSKSLNITHGETMAVQAVFKDIPDIIYANQPVNLDLSLSVIDSNIENYDVGSAVAKAHFAPSNFEPEEGNGGYPNFENDNNKYWFELSKFEGFDPIHETLTAQFEEGEKGQQIALYTELFFSGVRTGTKLIYEWKMLALQGDVGPSGNIEVPKDEDGKYIDSGYTISEAMGEVYVRRGDDRLGWEMAYEGDILYEGDVIMTKNDSAVIISCPDLTSFNMTSNSSVGVDITKEETNVDKIILLYGKVMTNVKKMIKDGSMNVEMSQCVAGIKGTILICETDETSSSVQVIEGKVEVTDLKGEKVLLSSGEQVTVKDGALGKVQKYSINDELQNWPEETMKQVYADIEERSGTISKGDVIQTTDGKDHVSQNPDNKLFFFLAIGLGFVVAGVLIYKKMRK